MAKTDKEKLLEFLEKKIFKPVGDAKESSYSPEDVLLLSNSKHIVEERRIRYELYKRPEEIKNAYMNDLLADEKERPEWERLGIPSFSSLEKKFISLCEKLGI